MTNWYMLTVVGKDQAGIVAKLSSELFKANCYLGEASMMRLGDSFSIMLMINSELDEDKLKLSMQAICEDLSLSLHIDPIQGRLHSHHTADVLIIVSGSDREGIVAQVTNALFEAGMEILDLNSQVAGTKDKPIYIIQIEGVATNGIDIIQAKIESLSDGEIDIQVQSIDPIIG